MSGEAADFVVVDTDVISYQLRRDTRAVAYARHLSGRAPVASFMTVAELYHWALVAGRSETRVSQLEALLSTYTVAPSGWALCRRWAEVMIAARTKGRPIAANDAWIAATALHFGVPLVTNNARHYRHVDGLVVISEAAGE